MVDDDRYPTTWCFDLDWRTTHMSLVSPDAEHPPIMATPDAIREMLGTFAISPSTPEDVRGILDVCHHLMVTSVVHYEFAALAVEKALQALELMLRFNVDEVDHGSKVTMAGLVDRLRKRFELRPDLDDLLVQTTKLHNTWVGHPRSAAAFSMVSAVGFLRRIHGAIAELVDLRRDPLAAE